jgi:hypothetical protein
MLTTPPPYASCLEGSPWWPEKNNLLNYILIHECICTWGTTVTKSSDLLLNSKEIFSSYSDLINV